MALNNLGLGFVFTAKDLASGVIGRVRSSFLDMEERTTAATKAFKANFSQFGQGLAIMGAGVGILAGTFALAGVAGEFEQAIAGVGAVSGATAEELAQLENAAIEAGIATQFSPTQATLGLRDLAQAGFNAQESIQLLLPVLDLAAGSLGELSPQAAAGLAAQAMKAFGIEASGAGLAVDQMLQAVNVFALSASELPLALGTSSRGAQALSQSLTETLVALGLVKNIIPGVERASTATAVAMERLADPRVQQRLRGIGVAAVTSSGEFRPFLDVIGDLAPALDRMTESQRSAFLLQSFGREALGGVNAILTQVNNGIRTNTGETLRGAAALGYLRQQFDEAGGTAANFRDRLLDTFEGQKTLLRGSAQTLAISIGQPLAAAFRPIVMGITSVMNVIIRVVRGVPGPVRNALAKLAVGVGFLATSFGAFVAAKAGLALFVIGLKAIGLTVGGVVASLGPLLLVFAAVALVAKGFAFAFERDLGGIATFVEDVWRRVQLFFQGIAQLFNDGSFSGAVMEELNRAENLGIKQFAIRVFQIVFRIKRFFEGIAEGFGSAVEAAAPVFESFVGALRELGQAFGIVGSSATDAVAGIDSDELVSAGASIGATFGRVIGVVVEALTTITRVTTGIINGVRYAYEFFRPIFDSVGEAFAAVGEELRGLIADFSGADAQAREGGATWRAIIEIVGALAGVFGTVLVSALGAVALVLRGVITTVRVMSRHFMEAARFIADMAVEIHTLFVETIPRGALSAVAALKTFFRPLVDFLSGIVEAIRTTLDQVVAFTGRLVSRIPSQFRPAFLDGLVDAGHAAETRIAERAVRVGGPGAQAFLPGSATTFAPSAPVRGSATLGTAMAGAAMPVVAEVQARRDISDADIEALVARGVAATEARPLHANITLNVDGETLAQATARAQRSSAARSFLPVPTGG